LADAHHHGLHHLALLHAAARNGLLDRDHNHVADGGVALLGATEDLDAHDPTRAGIAGHVEVGLHLDHDALLVLAAAPNAISALIALTRPCASCRPRSLPSA